MLNSAKLVAVALTAFLAGSTAASGQPYGYRQPTGGGLGSVFNCDATGGRQEGGALIGGIVGALAGSQVSKHERGLGAALGAGLGAAAGSWVGCKLQRDDQTRMAQATEQALAYGQPQTWENPNTGASGRVSLAPDSYGGSPYAPADLSGLRLASGVQLASAYEPSAPQYAVTTTTSVRAAPSTRSGVTGRLRRGERFQALGRVRGRAWILVGQNGLGVGYVPTSVARPVSGYGYASGAGGDCRVVEQTVNTRDYGADTQRYRACRARNGEWQFTRI
jgi:surface antigen